MIGVFWIYKKQIYLKPIKVHEVKEYNAPQKGPFKNLCQSGKITNTQGHTDEYKNRCRTVCS